MKVGIKEMEKISVLMSTYNESLDWVGEAIKSINTQTYSNFEFIIICDNPENKELVTFLENEAKKDNRIRLIINSRNIGLASSLNKAFKQSTGDFIARMDADDIAKPNRFKDQLHFLKSHNNVDLLCGNVEIINENGIVTSESKNIVYTSEELKKILEIWNVLMHPTFFMRKESFEKVGGYRNFPAAEDYDFILRGLIKGLKMYQFKETVLSYRMRENSMTFGNALVSLLCTTYIRELYIEQKKRGRDTFSEKVLLEIKEVEPKEKNKFSNILFNVSVKYKKNVLMRIIFSFKGLLTSSYFRKYFYTMLKVSHQLKKYR